MTRIIPNLTNSIQLLQFQNNIRQDLNWKHTQKRTFSKLQWLDTKRILYKKKWKILVYTFFSPGDSCLLKKCYIIDMKCDALTSLPCQISVKQRRL